MRTFRMKMGQEDALDLKAELYRRIYYFRFRVSDVIFENCFLNHPNLGIFHANLIICGVRDELSQ